MRANCSLLFVWLRYCDIYYIESVMFRKILNMNLSIHRTNLFSISVRSARCIQIRTIMQLSFFDAALVSMFGRPDLLEKRFFYIVLVLFTTSQLRTIQKPF